MHMYTSPSPSPSFSPDPMVLTKSEKPLDQFFWTVAYTVPLT